MALTSGTPVHATQTDNFGFHAVPRPGAVTIDGKLSDWDLSGQALICYDLESLQDVYSGRLAAMYDADNLYISIDWKDPVPMGNSHDPRYTAHKAWAGDCVQLRIKTDRISHITAWYSAPTKEPAITISYGKSLTEPFGGGEALLTSGGGNKLDQGAEMGFAPHADGKGYVQEIKLPWKLITNAKQFGAGDKINMGVELLWGEADWPVHRYADNMAEGATSREFFWMAHNSWGNVHLEPAGKLKLKEPAYMAAYRMATQGEAPQGPVEISYRLPARARVTLAINDATGKRVRNLIPALERPAGRNTEKWDGMDDNGKPVPPGSYQYKILFHDGIKTNYVMSYASPGQPTWDTSDGKGAFYGDHSAPHAATAAGEFVALGCPTGEAGKYLIGVNLDGQRQWGLPNRAGHWARRLSLATDGKLLWVAQDSSGTIYRVDGSNGKYAPWSRTAKDEAGKEYQVLDLKVTEPNDPKKPLNLAGIAHKPGELAVALLGEGKVKILDPDTGEVKRTLDLAQVRALTYLPDGDLVILAGDSLRRVKGNGDTSPFGSQSFSEGWGLAADRVGNVYISVRGQDQNVKVLGPDGRLLREIGKRGGRPAVGPYDAAGMRDPAAIAVDCKGQLWVTEETSNPKRTSVWNSATGALIRDLAGTTNYAGAGGTNPHDASMAFADDTQYNIDLANGAWRPVYSLGHTGHEDDVFPLRLYSRSRVFNRGKFTYAYTSDRTGGVRCSILRDGRWYPAAFVGTVAPKLDPEVDNNFLHPLLKPNAGKAVSWSDLNADGLVQANELTFTSPAINGKRATWSAFYWGTLPDEAGTISFVAREGGALVKLPVTKYTEAGVPVYDVNSPVVQILPAEIKPGHNGAMIMGGKDGRVYINQSPLVGVDGAGKILFTYPNNHVSVHGSHTAKASRPGYIIGPSSVLGTADMGGETGEVFYLNGNLGENYLFTWDGLYIQSLFKDTRGYFDIPSQAVRGMSMDATTAGGESFGGHFFRSKDGKCYVTLGGTDARIIQVNGLDTLRRQEGKLEYSPRQYGQAAELAAKKALASRQERLYKVARATTAPVIDGKSTEWPELQNDEAAMDIRENEYRRYGKVAARYDQENLYLGYRVNGPGKPRNEGQDYRLLFKTGDLVDLMIGPAGVPENAPGNMRLILAFQSGKPVAVLNQKVAPGASPTEKFGFSSPWRTIAFDRVVQQADVKLATAPHPAGGHTVEAAIPWKVLGITPAPGTKLRADVGLLLADAGGTMTVARHYWSNKATGLVNDVPGEADITPGLWGQWTLE